MPQDTQEDATPTATLRESPNNFPDKENDGIKQDDCVKENTVKEPSTTLNFVIVEKHEQLQSMELHPGTRPLTISDLESVVALENAAFPVVEERATREKLEYRLTKCGELCLGIFHTMLPGTGQPETLVTGHLVETSREDGAIGVLLGHVIATRTDSLVASDESMDYPRDWKDPDVTPSQTIGHQEGGRTIVLHSVAILPDFQGQKLGTTLMRSYMQIMASAGIADRLALIAHDVSHLNVLVTSFSSNYAKHKVDFYKKLGFTNMGKSKAQFGGGGWYDM